MTREISILQVLGACAEAAGGALRVLPWRLWGLGHLRGGHWADFNHKKIRPRFDPRLKKSTPVRLCMAGFIVPNGPCL